MTLQEYNSICKKLRHAMNEAKKSFEPAIYGNHDSEELEKIAESMKSLDKLQWMFDKLVDYHAKTCKMSKCDVRDSLEMDYQDYMRYGKR